VIWRLLGAGTFAIGVAAGALIPVSGPADGDPSASPRAREAVPESSRPGAVPFRAAQRDELETLLQGVRGVGPIACGLALLALDGRGYRGPEVRADIEVSPGSPLSTRALTRWVTHPPRDPALVPPLRTALADADSCVRRTAARLLGRNRTDPAVTALLNTLRTSDAVGRRSAALALGVAGRPSTAPALREALRDDDAGVRAAAAWALGELSDRASVPSLVRMLGADEDPVPRKLAAWALGEIR
jgi:hypothetical protein